MTTAVPGARVAVWGDRAETRKTTIKTRRRVRTGMSQTEGKQERQCVSCGINISGMSAAAFKCPDCGQQIYRCAKCRKQSNLYECPDCGFRGP